MPVQAKLSDSFGKLLLRRRSPNTSFAVGLGAIAAIALPGVAIRAETEAEWLLLVLAALPFALFFASSLAVRLEIFERVIRVRKLWGTRVLQRSQLESCERKPGISDRRARLIFRPRDGRILQVTVESDEPDEEMVGVMEEVTRHASSPERQHPAGRA